ncbi:MAG: orotidine 5'-phosphate decarboxylase, partial [Candidatus Heimdallarchaeota archaeon]|nr:orotidine 5'-phosphate decarboxylase [Candidatus Heimdallarchaeota archaeon]
ASDVYKRQPYTSVIKINRQYTLGLTIDDMIMINKQIHNRQMLSMSDHKLGDIGSSNESAIFWFREEGFDAFTFNPYSGNVQETTELAHKSGLGIIVLTLMSNPQAILQKEASIQGKPLYQHIAQLCKEANSDGCVIGATAHVEPSDILEIHRIVGENAIALVPGVGEQGGSADTLLKSFKTKTMVNVSRGVIYSPSPAEKAKELQDMLNNLLN